MVVYSLLVKIFFSFMVAAAAARFCSEETASVCDDFIDCGGKPKRADCFMLILIEHTHTYNEKESKLLIFFPSSQTRLPFSLEFS